MSTVIHGNILRKLMDNHELSVIELAENLGLSTPNMYKYLKFGSPGPLKGKRFSKAVIAFLCLLFDESPKIFGEDDSLFSLVRKDGEIIRSETANLFFGASSEQGQNETQFLQTYFTAIKTRLTQAKKSYRVYDCFYNNYGVSHSLYSKEYSREHTGYFAHIEEVLKESSSTFTYERIAALSPGTDEMLNKEQVLHQIVLLMLQETFEHIWTCYQRYPDKFSFFITEPMKSPRKYTYGLIDDGQTIISEYDLYKEGVARPDILFIEQSSGPNIFWIKQLAKVYTNEFAKLATLPRSVTAEELQHSIHTAEIRQQKYIKALKRKMEVLKKLPHESSLDEEQEIHNQLIAQISREIYLAEDRLRRAIRPKIEFLNRTH